MPDAITPEALAELLQRHMQCAADSRGRCGLLMFCAPLAWELNHYFLGIDSGFRRVADRPRWLGRCHFEELE